MNWIWWRTTEGPRQVQRGLNADHVPREITWLRTDKSIDVLVDTERLFIYDDGGICIFIREDLVQP